MFETVACPLTSSYYVKAEEISRPLL